jgi:ribonuclease P protein component
VAGGHDPSGRATSEEPRLGRLTKRPEFLAAATGRRFHTERVTVQGRRRDGLDMPDEATGQGLRVGLTVTKRVGHATERNRIRRRLRAAIRQSGVPFATAPLDIVLIGRRDALWAEFPQLIEDLNRALPAVLRSKTSSARMGRGATSPGAAGVPARSHLPSQGEQAANASSSHRRDATRSRTNPRPD